MLRPMCDRFDGPYPSTPMLAMPVGVFGGVSQAPMFVALFVDQNTLNPVPIVGGVHHVFFAVLCWPRL